MEYKDFEFHMASSLQKDELSLSEKQLEALFPHKKNNKNKLWIFLAFGLAAFFIFGAILMTTKGKHVKTIAQTPTSTHQLSSNQFNDPDFNNNNDILKISQNTASTIPANPLTNNQKKALISNNNNNNNNNLLSQAEAIQTSSTSFQGESEVITAPDMSIESNTNITENRNLLLDQTSMLAVLDPYPILSKQNHGIKTKKIKCADFFVGRRLTFSIIPEIGIFYPFKKLGQNTGEPTQLLPLRKDNERALEGIFGAIYGRMTFHKSGFYVQTGVAYARQSEKMSLSYDYIQRDTSRVIISTTISSNGDTITNIYGDIIEETHFKGQKNVHYNFSLVDIPLIVGYERPYGNWIIGADVGINLNLSLSTGGRILSTPIAFQAINSQPYTFNKSIGVYLRGSLHIGKEISENVRLYLALRGSYIPNSYSTDNNPIFQRYSFGGGYLGMIYKL